MNASNTPNANFELSVQWAKTLISHPLRKIISKRHIQTCLQECLRVVTCTHAVELTVRIVDESEAKALNQTFRHRRYTPNVLTFAYTQTPILMADLVLCAQVVEKEALVLRREERAHFSHLLVHACLHALGFEHEHDEWQAMQMECLEVMILDNLKFDNPYAP
jgi:probable rRNA maturation factor